MKKTCATLVVILICTLAIYAQSNQYSIQVKKAAIGTSFLQNEEKLSPRQLLEITRYNQSAYEEMKRAKGNYDASTVLGAIGGFLVGWPLGTAIAGGDPNWTMAGIGAGFIGVSIPFTALYTKQAKNAVDIHNQEVRRISHNNFDLGIGITGNGFGLRLKL